MRPWVVLIILLCLPTVFGAQLTGTVYTESLQPAKYSLLTINTTPAQRILLPNGTYSLNVPRGTYQLSVVYTSGKRYEDMLEVTVVDERAYSYDFILFPVEGNLTTLPTIDDITLPESPNNTIGWWPAALLLVLLLILTLAFSRRQWWERAPQGALPADLESIVVALRKEGGRTTQKELRKHIPCSEAKMSMMLTELEAKGRVGRIKKGRGNLIVLK